jgi:hypothetical protein
VLALPSWLIEPTWDACQVLLLVVDDLHPLGCRRPRIPDRLVFDKLVQILVFGCTSWRIADATTLRRRRHAWIAAAVMTRLDGIVLSAYDSTIGLDLDDMIVDGCITNAPCGAKWPDDHSWIGANRA